MMELKVTLDFACCHCSAPVGVTVRCTGQGLAHGGRDAVAAVHVPCPSCGQTNELLFEPAGAVRDVRPPACRRPVPAPCWN
jgi:hypothetical protein